MQFHEFGDRDGAPLVFFMGTPQRGDAGQDLSELASGHNIRLICPTRPWYDEQSSEPSFDLCSVKTIEYLQYQGINSCHVMGGSGGGPFALHLSSNNPSMVRACYLLASMGTPDLFRAKVTSPPTLELLELFGDNSYEAAIKQLGTWGLPQDLAHGAWADFKVLLGPWSSIRFDAAPMVFIHHGEGDENAPIESIRDLSNKLPKSEIRISPYASHAGLASDEACTEITKIFREISN